MPKLPHEIAAKGFQAEADAYAKARPSYPIEAINLLQKLTNTPPSETQILDLGAGTGIMTRLLFERGYTSLTAVEPVDAMRAKISLPSITCLPGTAWSLPVTSQSQDVVILAQCFHWFDDIKSLTEIHRVLKPGGLIVLIWNMESKRASWVAKLRDLYEAFDDAAPQYRKGHWKRVFDEAGDLYTTPLQHETFQYDTPAKKSDVWTRITSRSYIAILDKQTQEDLHEKVKRVIDELDEEFIYPHDTDMYWCYKK